MKDYYVVTFTIPNGVQANSPEEAKAEAIRTLNECIRHGFTEIDEVNITEVKKVKISVDIAD
jgi:hypothetical protein